MSAWLVYSIGFLAQLLFASRLVVQWIVSERHKKVVAPTVFWLLSLMASILLFIYGFLRDDLSIMLGQLLTYMIYIRNLQLQNKWQLIKISIRYLILTLPLGLLLYFMMRSTIEFKHLIHNPEIPMWLLTLGIIAQLIFTFRFVIQWVDSERQKTSILPLSFWMMSLIGAILILIYAIIRLDWVLLIGHTFGSLIYLRNIQLIVSNTLAQPESEL